MSTVEIKVPEESHEGTTMKVQSWLKQAGESVKQFEPIVEMETDKVTMEIEAPADGVIEEVLIVENTDVEPGAVLGLIRLINEDSNPAKGEINQDQLVSQSGDIRTDTKGTRNSALSSAVRRYVAEYNLDPAQISGTGKDGRVTLNDVKAFHQLQQDNASLPATNHHRPSKAPAMSKAETNQSALLIDGQKRPHTAMRRSIAENMVNSVQQSPHVTSVFELDFTAIATHRAKHKSDFAERGVKLTYTAYFLRACVIAMQAVPELNSQWHDEYSEIFSDINIGVGTALADEGLVVPVIPRTQEKTLFALAKELEELTDKARNKQLKATDMRGGTFTISNHGVSGSLLATPIIINQPQAAILGIGALEKRVVVREIDGQDAILIRPMAYVSLTIDHRLVDAYQTNKWLSVFVEALETWDDRENSID